MQLLDVARSTFYAVHSVSTMRSKHNHTPRFSNLLAFDAVSAVDRHPGDVFRGPDPSSREQMSWQTTGENA